MFDRSNELSVRVNADITPLRQSLKEASRLSVDFGGSLTRAFTSAVVKGQSLSDVMRKLALDMSRMVLRQALKPVSGAINNAMSGLLGGIFGFAKGGLMPGPMVTPFAAGGVIRSPVGFPLGGGHMGVAGEAGAEAIMPLARGPDGRLGVRADGPNKGVNINFNVTASDADSFARSEPQILAMLNRAVSQGQRNL